MGYNPYDSEGLPKGKGYMFNALSSFGAKNRPKNPPLNVSDETLLRQGATMCPRVVRTGADAFSQSNPRRG